MARAVCGKHEGIYVPEKGELVQAIAELGLLVEATPTLAVEGKHAQEDQSPPWTAGLPKLPRPRNERSVCDIVSNASAVVTETESTGFFRDAQAPDVFDPDPLVKCL